MIKKFFLGRVCLRQAGVTGLGSATCPEVETPHSDATFGSMYMFKIMGREFGTMAEAVAVMDGVQYHARVEYIRRERRELAAMRATCTQLWYDQGTPREMDGDFEMLNNTSRNVRWVEAELPKLEASLRADWTTYQA